LLLEAACGASSARILAHPEDELGAEAAARFEAFLDRRSGGEPVAYITGIAGFYGRSFRVDPRVLIPRPETELLVDACLEALPVDAQADALDLCAGSGCVGLTLLAERPGLRLTAVELSAEAAQVARENAAALGLAGRYELLEGDLFAPLGGRAGFRLIAANPPYVPTGEIARLAVEVRDHDPRLALDGGADGLAVIRPLVAEAARRLASGGTLALEIGEGQGPTVRALLEAAGLSDVRVVRDYARLDRIVVGSKR
ncbi:MAG TPA: peptide chain release factor N(5)-glutamine methyltransferase, partial [Solirubrobacteraceae bacterium]|nr:peptide chain release factor N(5)-glutamine methyltransferase [Solirubrobacteraceae bacterium]